MSWKWQDLLNLNEQENCQNTKDCEVSIMRLGFSLNIFQHFAVFSLQNYKSRQFIVF